VIVEPAARRRLRPVARVLLGYGVVGLTVAGLGLVALVVGLDRVNRLADRIGGDVGGVSVVLERTATVLDDAATSARSFSATVDSSTAALGSAAGDLRGIVPRLRDIESQAGAIDILGSRPLAPIAGLFGQIAGQLTDLDAQLDGIATDLAANRTALGANATSLAELADETHQLVDRLGGDTLSSVLDDLRLLLVAMLAIGTLGAAVPAVGALLAGLWLRRQLRPGDAPPRVDEAR
jgi:hypothetical protein